MSSQTSLENVKNLSNVVQFHDGEKTAYWASYRKSNSSSKAMRMAHSEDGLIWDRSEVEKIGITPRTDNDPQLVVAGLEMFLKWIDDQRNMLLATKRGPDPNNPEKFIWSKYVRCMDSSARVIKEPKSGSAQDAVLGAVLVGDNILVSVLSEDLIEYYLFPTDSKAYDVDKNRMIAVDENSVSRNHINVTLQGGYLKSFRKRNTMTIFSQSPDKTFLFQAVDAKDNTGKDRILMMEQRLSLLGDGFGLPEVPQQKAEFSWWPDSTANNMSLVRDPGGRIVATYLKGNEDAYRCLLSTDQLPFAAKGEEKIYDDKVTQSPVVFHSLGEESKTTIDGKRVQQRDVSEWTLFVNNKRKVLSQSNPYGKVQRVFKIEQLNLTKESENKTVFVQGYIDGPPPVFDGMVNPFSIVEYAKTSAKDNSFEVVNSIAVGSQTNGNTATAVGTPGLAWERSFKMGVASSFRVEDHKSISENTSFQLEKDQQGKFWQKQLVRSSDIVLTRDTFLYIPEGEIEPATDAPIFSQIYLDIRPNGKIELDLGTVTVGNLNSYTSEKWTERMEPLYPDIEGFDYIEDIIKVRAVNFDDGTPTVDETWTPGSPAEGFFKSTATNYDSSSISLETSAFAGVSAKFMGAEATAMIGFETSVKATTASTKSEGFGLSIEIDGSPGGPIASFQASAYLLPASNDWVRELIHFHSLRDSAKKITIEPSSSCWKIMYVVDQIECNDPIEDLALSPELTASLKAEEVNTTQDLLNRLGMDLPNQLRGKVDWLTESKDLELLEALRKWDVQRNTYPKSDD